MPVPIAAVIQTGKLLAPLLVKVANHERKRWYRRVAVEVARQSPYPIPKRAFRKALRLPKMLDLIGSGDEADAEAAVALLRAALGADRIWRGLPDAEVDARCAEVLFAAQKTLLGYLTPADGLQVADARAATRHRELTDGLGSIDRRLDDGARVESRLGKLPPGLVGIEDLVPDTPRLAELVAVVADDPDRTATLRAWAAAPPQWLDDAPARVWVVFGEALHAVGENDAAIAAFRRAEDLGATPVGYAAGRAAWLGSDLGRDEEALSILEPVLATKSPHPLPLAIERGIHEDYQRAAEIVAAWEPASARDEDLAALLQCKYLVLAGDEDGGIRALESQVAATRGGAIPLMLARLLTSRAYRRRATAGRDADFRRAADLALRARDRGRAWSASTVASVVTAADAMIFSRDLDAAWRLLRPMPEGDATEEEASSPEVQAKAAIVAAMTGRTALATELAAATHDPFEIAHLEAVIAERGDRSDVGADPERLANLWHAAYAAATTDEQRMTAARGLRAHGESVPDYERLKEAFPEAAAEAEELALLSALPVGERIAHLRGRRDANPYAAVQLAELLDEAGDVTAAAAVLAEAADRFHDQHLRLDAARLLFDRGELEPARAEAEAALAKAPDLWSGRRRALATLVEIACIQGRWANAAEHAEQMLGMDAADDAARWALVAALANQGLHGRAWDAVRQSPTPLTPQNKFQAGMLLDLTRRFGEATDVIRDAVALLRRYGDDEQFGAQVLATVYGQHDPDSASQVDTEEATELEGPSDPPSPELAELHQATEEFFERFPDTTLIRQITFTTPEEALEKIADELRRPGDDRRSELAAAVRAGRFPSGMLCLGSARPYGEIFVRRATGSGLVLRSADPAEDGAECDALAAVLCSPVITEASALNTLAVLDAALRDRLIGAHEKVSITQDALRDLIATRDGTAQRPTLFATLDPVSQQTVLSQISDADADAVAKRGQLLLDLAQRLTVLRWPQMQHFTKFDEPRVLPWLGPVDAAKASGQPLWSDDLALRRLARSEGVVAFGTTTLLDVLVRRGLPEDDRERALLALAEDYSADLDFRPERVEVVAGNAGWRPAAAAYSLSRASAWRDPAAVLEVLRKALASCPDPESAAGWMQAASTGLIASFPEPARSRETLERLLALAFAEHRVVGPFVPAVVAGSRAAARQLGAPDPFEGAIRRLHRGYLAASDEITAAQALLALVAGVDDPDRLVTAKVIIEPR